MPQGPIELHEKWQEPWIAFEHLKANFVEDRGIIWRKDMKYQPTDEDWSAIDYLCMEWDFGYDSGKRKDHV